MDFHGIDLNLLAAFDALMKERNVSRAATQVGVSQPAMSAALARLRKLTGDPLFIRSSEGLLPTARARDLEAPVAQALRHIETALVKQPAFAPEEAAITFTLGLSDYPAFVLLPLLQKALKQQARGVELKVVEFTSRDSAVDLLDAGEIDAAIGVPPTQQEGRIITQPILKDEFVTAIRRDHPAARRGMDLQTYLSLEHVLVSPEGDRHGVVDQALALMNLRREIALSLPQMFAAPMIVAQTDLVTTLLKRVALNSPAQGALALFPPPVVLAEVWFGLIWHRRNDTHPAQVWLRNLIKSVAASLD
ncbi:LysR family transcriptional regulator [Hahella sp. KA22]|uniref:LysR family transcriptional regulator n=1 Tax=Hahella sp. KA22 TaxID=1628392 RepID=UPI000FDD400B|nr:LysR family transcriptional regulator [Hahella sp. KA22]AZZ92644.1 LysR family transcriptional regulator [Hahella sp. KA22]QAY56017.1 LysR family transcriptional regulator [Hahella sp. KA22]